MKTNSLIERCDCYVNVPQCGSPKLLPVKAVHLTESYLTFRNTLLKTNKNLSHVLVDVLKTTAAAEETLGLHMQSLSASSGSTVHSEPLRAGSHISSTFIIVILDFNFLFNYMQISN